MTDPESEFNDTLKRLMDSKPKPQEDVKGKTKSKRESERRRKMGPIDPLKRRRRDSRFSHVCGST